MTSAKEDKGIKELFDAIAGQLSNSTVQPIKADKKTLKKGNKPK